MLEYLKTANNFIMWISCIPAVALVVFQAYIFMMRAWKTGPKMGVSKEQMKEAAKSSFVASLGPSIVIVSGMVSLLASVGGPLAWMRLAYIGSVMYELPAADRAASAAGCQLGTSNMTMEAFANAAWIMTVCCLGWILVSALFTDKMESFRDKVTGGNMDALVSLTAGGGVGGFGYMVAQRLLPLNLKSANMWSAIVGFAVMWCMNIIIKKTGARWAQQFGMTIAMFLGMVAGSFFLNV
ncbi:MAG: DUF5058 family protein [Clostridiaceae bacterium]|nr:DUF5058 family protein [Clostridiaceae bacterium]